MALNRAFDLGSRVGIFPFEGSHREVLLLDHYGFIVLTRCVQCKLGHIDGDVSFATGSMTNGLRCWIALALNGKTCTVLSPLTSTRRWEPHEREVADIEGWILGVI